jgi:DNA (cytosine-5)-methyltransferase 1
MKAISLFSGIGGLDLAAQWAGFETVLFCEKDPFCQQVLKKHWPNVPVEEDVRNVSATRLIREYGIRPGTITLLHGGFPCQPFSVAGQRRGAEDDRFLWPEMLRVITEIRPRWVCAENVAGIVSLALDDVLSSLEAADYAARAVIVPACAVGAAHRRDRVFIAAHSNSSASSACREENTRKEGTAKTIVGIGTIVTDSDLARSQGREIHPERADQWPVGAASLAGNAASASKRLPDWAGGEVGRPDPLTEFERPGGREIERDFRGISYGVSRRVDRLRSLGNAVVPQQVYPILKAIADYEKGLCDE